MPRRTEPHPLCEKIGRRIEDMRIEKNLNLEALSDRCSSGKGHLSNIERGLVAQTVVTLDRLAHGLDERPFTLLLFPEENRFDRLVEMLRTMTPAERNEIERQAKQILKRRK